MQRGHEPFRGYFTAYGIMAGTGIGGFIDAQTGLLEKNLVASIVIAIGGAALGGLAGYFGTKPFNRIFR